MGNSFPQAPAVPGKVGRFAPSPSGELHFGSLVAAVGSYLQAKASQGQWLLRVEDIDPPREVAGSAERIIDTLAAFGMMPDGPVLYQSSRQAAYEEALAVLLSEDKAFYCACSRATLPSGQPYPGRCSKLELAAAPGMSIRLRVDDSPIEFIDQVQGPQRETLTDSSGDFIIRRTDGLIAYQLAVVLDDAAQGITEVVRGADLLDSTGRQIRLQRALGLPTPDYCHLPVVNDSLGRKLSKRWDADPINAQSPLQSLGQALSFLGHEPPDHDDIGQRWRWALKHWNLGRVPRNNTIHS